MNYRHPAITIDQPAPGHYVISGHKPKSVFLPDIGHIVPLSPCYITPEVPTDALLAIIADRDGGAKAAAPAPKRATKGGLK